MNDIMKKNNINKRLKNCSNKVLHKEIGRYKNDCFVLREALLSHETIIRIFSTMTIDGTIWVESQVSWGKLFIVKEKDVMKYEFEKEENFNSGNFLNKKHNSLWEDMLKSLTIDELKFVYENLSHYLDRVGQISSSQAYNHRSICMVMAQITCEIDKKRQVLHKKSWCLEKISVCIAFATTLVAVIAILVDIFIKKN